MSSGLSFVFNLGLREIGGVGVRMAAAHVAGLESNGGVGMSDPIAKELVRIRREVDKLRFNAVCYLFAFVRGVFASWGTID